MKKSILLIGLGRFGKHMAEELNMMNHQVMAVDRDEDKVNLVLPYVTNAQIGDSTDELFLKSLGVEDFDICYVTIGSDFLASLETTYLLKELGARCVISRAEQDVQTKFLLRNGADDVVYPEQQMAKWAAIRYSSDYVLDYIDVDENHSLLEAKVPKNWVGRTISQIDIRRNHEINVVAVKKADKFDVIVSPDMELTEDMTLLVIGQKDHLRKCFGL